MYTKNKATRSRIEMRGNKKRRERKKPSKKKKQLLRDATMLRTQAREKEKRKEKKIQESTLSKVSSSLSRISFHVWDGRNFPPLFKYLDEASSCYIPVHCQFTKPPTKTSPTRHSSPPPCFSRETFETGVS